MTHRLSDAFEPSKRANRRQHMRRISSLLASCLDPATLAAQVQQLIEQAAFCSLSQQSCAKFAEH